MSAVFFIINGPAKKVVKDLLNKRILELNFGLEALAITDSDKIIPDIENNSIITVRAEYGPEQYFFDFYTAKEDFVLFVPKNKSKEDIYSSIQSSLDTILEPAILHLDANEPQT